MILNIDMKIAVFLDATPCSLVEFAIEFFFTVDGFIRIF
jgi:hypothetical protein